MPNTNSTDIMPECVFEGLRSQCTITADDRVGPYDVWAYLNPCTSPIQMDLNLKMYSYGQWEFNFLAGNQPESRQIGPDFWPLSLRVEFDKFTHQPKHYFVKACLESLKTGDTHCFLNQSFTEIEPCSYRVTDHKSALWLIVFSLIFAVIFFTLVTSIVVLWRRFRIIKKYNRQFNDSSYVSVPNLPGAKPYNCENRRNVRENDKKLLNMDGNDSKGHNDSLFVIEEVDIETTELPMPSHNLQESKLVQTSLTSLDTGIASANSSTNGEKIRESPV